MKKIKLTFFNKFILLIVFTLFLISGTSMFTQNYYESQIRIIYNLDKKQNDKEIINLINGANKYVYFAIYTFTKDNIADSLVKAKKRGLIVWGITDRQQSESSFEKPIIQKLKENGISIEVQKHMDGIMHIKAIVTDKAYAMGSYNWTQSATIANDELLEVGTDKNLHDRYLNVIIKVLKQNE